MVIIKEKEMPTFTGLKNNFFTGVIEDRNDPLYLGRVRVRIYGLHTDDKTMIASPDLPWSDVLMPTTAPSLSGLGLSPHGLVEGSTVMGFFRDEEDMQDFVVIGSLFGRPTRKWKIVQNNPDNAEDRSPEHGFNDPRRPTVGDYADSVDKPKTGRNFTLRGSLETSPLGRPFLTAYMDGNGTTLTNNIEGETYPRESYMGGIKTTEDDYGSPITEDLGNPKSDINENAITGSSLTYPNDVIQKHEGTSVKEPTRESISPQYPFNHMIESESGHILEMDDTPNAERLHLYHRSGSRIEFLRDGDMTMKVANNNYEIILKDKKVLIAGSADIELSNGNYNINSYKGSADNGGNINLTAHGGDINITTTDPDKAIIIKGKISLNGSAYD